MKRTLPGEGSSLWRGGWDASAIVPTGAVIGGELNQEILELLHATTEGLTPKQLAERLAEPGSKVRTYLSQLRNAGRVVRNNGRYQLVATAWDEPEARATETIVQLCARPDREAA